MLTPLSKLAAGMALSTMASCAPSEALRRYRGQEDVEMAGTATNLESDTIQQVIFTTSKSTTISVERSPLDASALTISFLDDCSIPVDETAPDHLVSAGLAECHSSFFRAAEPNVDANSSATNIKTEFDSLDAELSESSISLTARIVEDILSSREGTPISSSHAEGTVKYNGTLIFSE